MLKCGCHIDCFDTSPYRPPKADFQSRIRYGEEINIAKKKQAKINEVLVSVVRENPFKQNKAIKGESKIEAAEYL